MSKYNAIVVTKSLRGGHYRGGQYHGPELTKFKPKTFTEQQMEHLAADPDLLIVAGVSKGEDEATLTELPAAEAGDSTAPMEEKPESAEDSKPEAPQVSDGAAASEEAKPEGGDAPEPAKPEDAPAPEAKPKTEKKKD